MVVVLIVSIVTAGVLLWALYAERVPPRPVPAPSWAGIGLPDPDQVVRGDFPLVLAGYDQDAVDAHLRAVARAYTDVRERMAAAERALLAPRGPAAPAPPPPPPATSPHPSLDPPAAAPPTRSGDGGG